MTAYAASARRPRGELRGLDAVVPWSLVSDSKDQEWLRFTRGESEVSVEVHDRFLTKPSVRSRRRCGELRSHCICVRNFGTLLLLLPSIALAVPPVVIHVDQNATGPVHDGANWCSAFVTLDEALTVAAAGSTIRVANGKYTPDPTGLGNPREATFQLKNEVTIEGGYAGCGAPDPDLRDLSMSESILSGDLASDDGPDLANNDENSYQVVSGSATDASAILDGFTITGGNANGPSPHDHGAGVNGGGAAPTIRHCTITRNRAERGGGGIHDSDGDITDCMITENTVNFGEGGGLKNCDGAVSRCVIHGNSARWGAGLYECLATIQGCTITGNSADVAGGGLAFCNGAITRCRISGNASGNAGGGIYRCDGTIVNCVISGNSAAIEGGGLSRCGAGVANCTITGNRTTFFARGGAVADCSGGFTNCIFWDNTEPWWSASFPFPTYSCLPTNLFPEPGLVVGDPLFVEPGLRQVDGLWVDGDYHLLPGSRCIDAGDNTAPALVGVTTDLDGFLRFFDDPNASDSGIPGAAGAPIVDMGAYEFGDCNRNGIPDVDDIASGFSTDCNSNDIPDECITSEADCNNTGTPDGCDIVSGTSQDCNGNGIPDECIADEVDCNLNGVPDACDVADATSEDCTGNGIPDECEPDCNGNGTADICDVAGGFSDDCNNNDEPDECDIAEGRSPDDIPPGGDGIPDECQSDCNGNSIPDAQDTLTGFSLDCDGNEIPDECQLTHPAAISVSELNGSNGFVIHGIHAEGFLIEGAGAGDLNGDGIADMILAAPGAAPNDIRRAGESYVLFGRRSMGSDGAFDLSKLDGTNGFVIEGSIEGAQAGRSPAVAGDINDDGFDDLVIGAPFEDAGAVYVIFGGPSVGAGGRIKLIDLDDTKGFVINGVSDRDWAGFSVARAGDVNDDGIADIIIGAPLAGPGKSYVVFGHANVGAGGVLNLADLNGSNGFVMNGLGSNDDSGRMVSGARDVNSDGVDDLIIGAHRADPLGVSNAGESYVIFGKTMLGAGGTVDLAGLDGTNGFVINGAAESDFSGLGVSAAGDFNADGFDDLLVGAFGEGSSLTGASYVVFGGTSITSSGVKSLGALDGTDGFVMRGLGPNDHLGNHLASAGDVNIDGVDDVIVGAWGATHNGIAGAGAAYVLFGGAGVRTNGTVDLAILNGNDGFVVTGVNENDSLGGSVAGIGDINGDGRDDIAVGAWGVDANGLTNAGAVYVVFGGLPSDCNNNGLIDACETADGVSEDCNGNGIPDECDANEDCNANGIQDICDIAAGTSDDCTANEIPDECEPDCNLNGVADTCDIDIGTSGDCNGNAIPDECIELEKDCNHNARPDTCDLADGGSADTDGNGVPDECQILLHVPTPEYPTIQAALNAAITGGTILVADGMYTGPGNKKLRFEGKLITLRCPNGPDACIIDCGNDGPGFFLNNGEGPGAVVDGFTITHCSFTIGGGMFIIGDPTITNCALKNNTADSGGGIYAFGSPTITNCAFMNNTADSGGGMYAMGSATITDCAFIDNTALTGGGLYNEESNSTISGCTFGGNSATASGARGGGMFNTKSSPTVIECLFDGNVARIGTGFGGGMYNRDHSSPTVTRSTFNGNMAWMGGGMVNFLNSFPRVIGCTFSGNAATGGGGGVYHFFDCSVRISSSIMWNNTGGAVDGSSIPHVSFSNVEGGHAGAGNIDADPLFADPLTGDYHLLTGSPCIDAGDPAFAPGPQDKDVDGQDRVQHCRVDMGVDETAFLRDCNANTQSDACELLDGSVEDCNANFVPDACEPQDDDCNTNLVWDPCDLEAGTSIDCNGDGVPDECELADEDCNVNGVIDQCDIADAVSQDCNHNGSPDECDLESGTSEDCDGNGIPDACEATGKMYWTGFNFGTIQRADTDGSDAETLVTGLRAVAGIALDLDAGKMYWTESTAGNRPGTIQRANLDPK